MPPGMVNIKIKIKIKIRVVAAPLSTLLNRVVIVPPGIIFNQRRRGSKAPKAFDLNCADML
jgi:hypothetical protein